MENPKVKSYLDNFVKARTNCVLRPLMEMEGTVTGVASLALSFAFMALFFSYVEFLGYLYKDGEKGENLSKNAVDFLREYFGRVNPKYREVGGLLYHIYRHGNIHQLKPKRIRLKDGTIVTWSIGSGTGDLSDPWHLTGYKLDGAVVLKVSENSLCNDLASAIDSYYEDLCKNAELRKNFEEAREALDNPETEDQIRRKRKYVLDSDFDFITSLPKFVADGESGKLR